MIYFYQFIFIIHWMIVQIYFRFNVLTMLFLRISNIARFLRSCIILFCCPSSFLLLLVFFSYLLFHHNSSGWSLLQLYSDIINVTFREAAHFITYYTDKSKQAGIFLIDLKLYLLQKLQFSSLQVKQNFVRIDVYQHPL